MNLEQLWEAHQQANAEKRKHFDAVTVQQLAFDDARYEAWKAEAIRLWSACVDTQRAYVRAEMEAEGQS